MVKIEQRSLLCSVFSLLENSPEAATLNPNTHIAFIYVATVGVKRHKKTKFFRHVLFLLLFLLDVFRTKQCN